MNPLLVLQLAGLDRGPQRAAETYYKAAPEKYSTNIMVFGIVAGVGIVAVAAFEIANYLEDARAEIVAALEVVADIEGNFAGLASMTVVLILASVTRTATETLIIQDAKLEQLHLEDLILFPVIGLNSSLKKNGEVQLTVELNEQAADLASF